MKIGGKRKRTLLVNGKRLIISGLGFRTASCPRDTSSEADGQLVEHLAHGDVILERLRSPECLVNPTITHIISLKVSKDCWVETRQGLNYQHWLSLGYTGLSPSMSTWLFYSQGLLVLILIEPS